MDRHCQPVTHSIPSGSLIQHTFPLPDGGGLRLTVAEYLTPALQHVTHVGGAQYDRTTGDWVGGGIRPDVYCQSRPSAHPGADLCVGVALDAIQEASRGDMIKRVGGSADGSQVRRPVVAGVVKVGV